MGTPEVSGSSSSSSSSSSSTRRLLDELSERLLVEETRTQMMEQVGAAIRLVVGSERCLVVDVRQGSGGIAVRSGDTKTEVDATLEMSDTAFALICDGKLSPHDAFMTGRLTVKGDMLRVMKSDPLFRLLRPRQQQQRQQVAPPLARL